MTTRSDTTAAAIAAALRVGLVAVLFGLCAAGGGGCATQHPALRLAIHEGGAMLGVAPGPGMWTRTKAAWKAAPVRSTLTAAAIAGAGYLAYEAWASEQSDKHHSQEREKRDRASTSIRVDNSHDVDIYVVHGDGNTRVDRNSE